MVTFGGLLINNPMSYEKLPYDAEWDFLPVSMLATDTIVIGANVGFAADDLAGLVSPMRAHPEAVRWSSAPGEPRLRFFGFLKQVDARPLYVPYKATSQAIIDMIAGRIDVMISPLAAVLPNARAGKLKLLAVMSPMRSKESQLHLEAKRWMSQPAAAILLSAWRAWAGTSRLATSRRECWRTQRNCSPNRAFHSKHIYFPPKRCLLRRTRLMWLR